VTYELSEDHLIALMLEEGTITQEDLLEWRMAEMMRRTRRMFATLQHHSSHHVQRVRALNELERVLRSGMVSLSEARARMTFPNS
jgi:hypothetical protein